MARRIATLACVVTVTVAALGPAVSFATAAQPEDTGLESRHDVAGPSTDGRFIVVLRNGTDAVANSRAHRAREGIAAGRVFRNALRGYTARLTTDQRLALLADPAVEAVVPDEPIELTQYYPTGVSRVGGRVSPMARINGIDDVSIDADVAIVDTGIDPTHPDLNVIGGIDCSSSDPTRWRDVHGHGTHVAGTVGARDDPYGVPGVAPGVRLWAVKILNDSGAGLLSWYVCGLDWIAAQRDPDDPTRPLIEAVNMSVTKWGRDDNACGRRNHDVLHAAICRVTGAGITVVAAAANDHRSAFYRVPAAYNEVITVSALADTDGKPGALGGRRCYSWGSYDRDDTFANFSNFGADIDLIAPGKCIWSTYPGSRFAYMSGTSMAAPHVTGAVALYKATRPWATPAIVRWALITLGSTNWRMASDPDARHERLLNVSRIGPWGDWDLGVPNPGAPVEETGGTLRLPVLIPRTSTMFETIGITVTADRPLAASLDRSSVVGFASTRANLAVRVPVATAPGTYHVDVTGRDWSGRTKTDRVSVAVRNDVPVAAAPAIRLLRGSALGPSSMRVLVGWPRATDRTSGIGLYQLQQRRDGGAWAPSGVYPAAVTKVTRVLGTGHRYAFRLRARDRVGNWSGWVESTEVGYAIRQDNNPIVTYRGAWVRQRTSSASGGTTTYTTRTGAAASIAVTASQVGLAMPMGPYRGAVRIYVDGAYAGAVSLHATRSVARRIVWSRTWSSVTAHTIEIRAVRLPGRPRIDFDGLIFVR